MATKKFTENYIKEIKDFRQWLLKKIHGSPSGKRRQCQKYLLIL
uniref:Uncharacterized protein n=1 Tax=uncultured Desulfobacterium sp. TaxID=201089 RepID=E1YJH1_9BACT|nr:unknown protein [uncultured Desulfobacterium sp.]